MRDFDAEIYESLRNQFEYILLRAVEPDRDREKVLDDVKVLLTCFNNTSKDCQRLAKKVRELNNV